TSLKDNEELPDATLSQMKADVLAGSAEADRIAKEVEPQLLSVQARLAELGAPDSATTEARDVAVQRAQLERNNSTFDAQVKLARLLSVEAEQVSEQISTLRRARLQARLGERTSSILSTRFWEQLNKELPQNLQRMRALTDDVGRAARQTSVQIWASIA